MIDVGARGAQDESRGGDLRGHGGVREPSLAVVQEERHTPQTGQDEIPIAVVVEIDQERRGPDPLERDAG